MKFEDPEIILSEEYWIIGRVDDLVQNTELHLRDNPSSVEGAISFLSSIRFPHFFTLINLASKVKGRESFG